MSVASSISNKTYDKLEPFASDLEQGVQEQIDVVVSPLLEEIETLKQRIQELEGSLDGLQDQVNNLPTTGGTGGTETGGGGPGGGTGGDTGGTGTGTGGTESTGPLTITTTQLGPTTNRAEFNSDGRAQDEIIVTGGVEPYTYSFTINPLELSINENGIVSGFVNVNFPGNFLTRVSVTDAAGTEVGRVYTINVGSSTNER